jgi:hypothetical protein
MAIKQSQDASEKKTCRISDELLTASTGLAQHYQKIGIPAVAAAARYHDKDKIAGGDAPRRSLHRAA